MEAFLGDGHVLSCRDTAHVRLILRPDLTVAQSHYVIAEWRFSNRFNTGGESFRCGDEFELAEVFLDGFIFLW